MHKPTVVFCWELGAGNGHVGPMGPLVSKFLEDGWRVALIVKDLSRLPVFFRQGSVEAFQAPVKVERPFPWIRSPTTFCELLLNMGYRSVEELTALVEAWRNLLRLIGPDVLVCDHAPTALIASRGQSFCRFTIGHGFYVPVDETPLGCLAPWRVATLKQRQSHELSLLATINATLAKFDQPPLRRMGELFSDVDRNLFTTYHELDHYQHRNGASYFGTWHSTVESTSETADWPDGESPRVYAYLKRMNALPELIEMLAHRRVRGICVVDESQLAEVQRFANPGLLLRSTPLRLTSSILNCDLAITNAGHATICQFLKHGVPQLLVPLTLEQALLSKRVESIAAGHSVDLAKKHQLVDAARQMLHSQDCNAGARAFADRNSASDTTNLARCFKAIIGSQASAPKVNLQDT